MRLLDANLLLYAHFRAFPQHARARVWLEELLNQPELVAMPWASLLAFVRLASNRHILTEPLSVADAWRQVEEWLDQPCVWMPDPGDRHRPILRALLVGTGVKPNDVPDAHLAALAMEYGLTLCTADLGFGRFRGLKWENPLDV